jgi:hypothetical protein
MKIVIASSSGRDKLIIEASASPDVEATSLLVSLCLTTQYTYMRSDIKPILAVKLSDASVTEKEWKRLFLYLKDPIRNIKLNIKFNFGALTLLCDRWQKMILGPHNYCSRITIAADGFNSIEAAFAIDHTCISFEQ